MSSSWTTSNVTINTFSKPQQDQNVRDGALWWNPNTSTVLSFGGEPYNTLTGTWALTLNSKGSGTWSQVSFSDSKFKTLVRPGYGLRAASSTTGYSMGGMQTIFPSDTYWSIPGLITFDFASQKWSNLSTIGIYSESGMALYGAGQFVPSFGSEGVMVMIGGAVPTNSWDKSGALRPMTNITVFDPSSQGWYSQTATGDIPMSRRDICIIGVQSSSESTYEIFIYGGWNGNFDAAANKDSSSVYILLLPAFRWIRAGGSAPSRAGSACLVVGNRQMISIGGRDPTSTAEYATADPWNFGIGMFDLTKLSWTDTYNAYASVYQRPAVVSEYYAANNMFPNWDNPALAKVFTAKTSTTTPTSTSTSSSTPSTSGTANSQESVSSVPKYAIALAVLGGVALLALAAFAFWWFLCRGRARKERRVNPSGHEHERGRYEEARQQVPELGVERLWEAPASEVKRPVEMDGRPWKGIKTNPVEVAVPVFEAPA
ncbi:hypothetical protein ACMFMG_003964 [Clarireedia jacksonii]